MSFKDDLSAEVRAIFSRDWDVQEASKVPAPEDLRLNQNHAKKLEDAVVLYADLDGSTSMVDQHSWIFSAEIYKAYLRCASQIVKRNCGTITAYDGDRVMAVDRSDLHAARIGVREDNDIVWVGRAANHAAKLCSLSEKPIWITEDIYDVMLDEVKYNTKDPTGTNMWEQRFWLTMNNRVIYSTTYRRQL